MEAQLGRWGLSVQALGFSISYTTQNFIPKLPPGFNFPLVGNGHIILLLGLNLGLLQSQRDLGLRVP